MTRNKKQNKKAAKAQRQQKQTPRRGLPVRSNLASAPAAVSSFARQYVRFGGGKGGEVLTMEACLPILNVGQIATGTAGAAPAIVGDGVTTFSGQSGQLGLTTFDVQDSGLAVLSNYLSPVFDLIGSAFTRYRIRKCSFHYCPQAPTSGGSVTGDPRYVFAFAEDPVHPLIWDAAVSQDTLLALSDSIPFAPWCAWDMDVTSRLKDKDLLYTYDLSVVNPGSTGADQRFSNFGSIGVLADKNNGAGGTRIHGILYMCLGIDLEEFCPVTTTRPSLGIAIKQVQCEMRAGKGRPVRRTEEVVADSKPEGGYEGDIPVPFDKKTTKPSKFPITSQGVAECLGRTASNRWKASMALSRLEGELDSELECVRGELGTDADRPENRMIISRLERTLKVLRAARDMEDGVERSETLISAD